MQKFKNNIKSALMSIREDDERGDIIQTLLIIGIFVAIIVAVGPRLWDIIQGQADKTEGVITGDDPLRP